MHFSPFLLSLGLPLAATATPNPLVKPFHINLGHRVPHMLELIKRTQLPASEIAAVKASTNSSLSSGLPLSTLKSLKEEWVDKFDWNKEQAALNK
jgi:hypothetical protein